MKNSSDTIGNRTRDVPACSVVPQPTAPPHNTPPPPPPPPPRKKNQNRVQKSAGIVLASSFWDEDGILRNHYLPKGQTINAEYYSSLLVQLKDILKEKRRGKVTKGVLFLHDNVPAHRALAAQKKLAYLGSHLY